MSYRSVYRIGPRCVVSIGRFLSWLPSVRPVLARRMIEDGELAQSCSEDLHLARGMMGTPHLVVGPAAAAVIIRAYKAGELSMNSNGRIVSTTRAEAYAQSPLRVGEFALDYAEVSKPNGSDT